eukprot:693812-Rhodomonas_salina.3
MSSDCDFGRVLGLSVNLPARVRAGEQGGCACCRVGAHHATLPPRLNLSLPPFLLIHCPPCLLPAVLRLGLSQRRRLRLRRVRGESERRGGLRRGVAEEELYRDAVGVDRPVATVIKLGQNTLVCLKRFYFGGFSAALPR